MQFFLPQAQSLLNSAATRNSNMAKFMAEAVKYNQFVQSHRKANGDTYRNLTIDIRKTLEQKRLVPRYT